MKTLNTIQKTCKVFKILAKIAMILSFVLAGLALVGIGFAVALKNGAAGLSAETMMYLTNSLTTAQMFGTLIAEFIFGLTDGILFLYAYRYFRKETEDGTPFTTDGAAMLKNLGIKTIVLPLVSVILAAVIYGACGAECESGFSNGASVALGIAMILFSLVLRHGAETMGDKIPRLPAEKNNLK